MNTHTTMAGTTGRAAVHASALDAVSKATEIGEDQIATTLANWDVQASGQRLFVARLKHEKTAGGLFIPGEYQEQQCDGVVISAGPLAYVNDEQPEDGEDANRRLDMTPDQLDCATRRFLQPGDRITFGKWSGDTVSRKGSVKAGLDVLMVMNADDVIGTPRTVG